MNKQNKIKQWIDKADSDLNAVKDLLESQSSSRDVICFHCQQAVEKYLKALLIALNIQFERIHDLVALLELLAEQHPELERFKEDMASLNVYAVDIRYPDDFYMPTDEESRKAHKIVLQIKEFCLTKTALKNLKHAQETKTENGA